MNPVYSIFECNNPDAAYYFFHIPKTAGTSLNNFLSTVFTENEICPPHLWHDLLLCNSKELTKYKLFRGHFYAYLNAVLDMPLRGFVFLRDPIERALSHYGHVVRDPNHYLHSRAKELGTFEAYLKDPVTKETLRNFQAKALVQLINPIEIASKLNANELDSFELERILETTPIDISDQELLERAKIALHEFCCVGISEQFQESLRLLGETFGWTIPDINDKLNSNPQRLGFEALTEVEKSLLMELNSVDVEFYQYALKVFQEQTGKCRERKSIAFSDSFTSYAQNFEDVMLWRALKHVKNGVYVDVGAQHPVVDSVSKAFYDRGWRGIHIEPVPFYAELLRKDRPDETVLQVALADAEGMLELNVIPDTGLSTAVDAYAQRHQIERGYEPQLIQVPVLTLRSALKSLEDKEVHWLKIDVEGFEEKVLNGWDSQTLRPWIMVVEATIPNSPETDYASWDPILIAADYQFVYFDGLNRFYVAREHAELSEAFSCPPNTFDNMELTENSVLCRGLIASHQASEKGLAAQAEELTIQLNAANDYNTQLQAHAQWLQNEWDAAKQGAEELSERLGQLEADLTSVNEHNIQLQAHAQRLQNEWDAAKQGAEELSERLGQLEADLTSVNEHNIQLQAHAQWLQNEWDVANAKISELNQSSHYWWTVANRLNQEQQIIYASKFWSITWPLRKIMQIVKEGLTLFTRIMKWIIRLPKHMIKLLMAWGMRRILNDSELTNCALNILTNYPLLKQHLRLFAMRSGLITDRNMMSLASHSSGSDFDSQNIVADVHSLNMQEESIDSLSPRAAHIYVGLKRAVDSRKN